MASLVIIVKSSGRFVSSSIILVTGAWRDDSWDVGADVGTSEKNDVQCTTQVIDCIPTSSRAVPMI